MSLLFFIKKITVDALFYGFFYERKIKGQINPVGIFAIYLNDLWNRLYKRFSKQLKWLFTEYAIVITRQNTGVILDHKNVFRYRVIIQAVIDIIFLALIYFFGIGFEISVFAPLDYAARHLEFFTTLIGLFFMVAEFGYYIELGQLGLVKEYQGNPYWLKRFYFLFGYIDFSYSRFKASFIIGCTVILIPYFIKLITILQ